MAAVLWVGAGGFLGAVGRYLLGLVPFEGDFPLMTFLVNFAGAVAIGAITEVAGATLFAGGSLGACVLGVAAGKLAVRGALSLAQLIGAQGA